MILCYSLSLPELFEIAQLYLVKHIRTAALRPWAIPAFGSSLGCHLLIAFSLEIRSDCSGSWSAE